MARRIATWLFFALVAFLIVRQARTIEWGQVVSSIQDLPLWAVATAAGLSVCSHLLYSTYDLLGRHMLGHPLGTGTVMRITFVSYAFTLNLSSAVGAVFSRYRLYSRYGLANETITKIVGFSMLTNWFGYVALAGVTFAFWKTELPPEWKIDSFGLHGLGAVLIVAALAYLALCALRGGHVYTVRGRDFKTPSLRMGLLQLAMSVGNWSLMAGMVWVLMPAEITYPQIMATMLAGALAGVVTHVPGSLGVLEAVFIALLGHKVAQPQLLGVLLAYRAVYYIAPLTLASVLFVSIEAGTRGRQTAPS